MWNELSLRVITRLLWPLIPISMEVAIRYLVAGNIVFPNQSILVLAFILPASYLTDFRGKVPIHLISMLCLIGTVPFVSSVLTSDPVVYWVGLYVFLIYAAAFLAVDVLLTYKKAKEAIE